MVKGDQMTEKIDKARILETLGAEHDKAFQAERKRKRTGGGHFAREW